MNRLIAVIWLAFLAVIHILVAFWVSGALSIFQPAVVTLTVDQWCDFLGATTCVPQKINSQIYELKIDGISADRVDDLVSRSQLLSGWATYGFQAQRSEVPNALCLTLQMIATEGQY